MKIREDGSLIWHHKDGNRYYWSIAATKTERREAHYPDEPESQWGVYWSYTIHRGGSCPDNEIFSGSLFAQVELTPDPQDFFNDFVSHLLSVGNGFAKYPDQWYGTLEFGMI